MLARTYSAGMLGIDGYVVTVESDIGPGLPGLTIVGQIDGPLHAAGMRALVALNRCGFALPRCKQIVNLAPAEQRKDSTGMDLAIACALLVSHGVIPAPSLADVMLWGELAPDGSLRPPAGTLIAAETARRNDFRVLALPCASAREAALIAGLGLLLVPDLLQLIAHLRGEATLARGPVCVADHDALIDEPAKDLADVSDPLARFALEVMIAGGHHLLVHGPHGSGKTTLAGHVAGLLGEVGADDALELTKLQATRSPTDLVRVPQVRMPNPTVSAVDLLGGGWPPRPGEVSLAHQGVLVLDELTEFSPACLDGLRTPLADGAVMVQGARFPARFRLLATMQCCPCEWRGPHDGACVGKRAAGLRSQGKLSRPLLDWIDLVVPLGAPAPAELADWPVNGIRRRIALAQSHQRQRLEGTAWASNAEIPTSGSALEQLCPLTTAAEDLLAEVGRRRGLDLRGIRRLHRVAQTVADLNPERDPSAPTEAQAIALASCFGRFPCAGGNRPNPR